MKHWKCYMRRKTRWLRITCLCSFLTLGYLYFVYISKETSNNQRLDKGADDLFKRMQIGNNDNEMLSWRTRHLFQAADENQTTDNVPGTGSSTAANNSNNGIYPPDVFTDEQKKNGAIILHVFGMIYMFVALAIVCDEFFVPALGVIIDRLKITDDVAGATFMAAGGSAPELFTSLFGVFLAQNNVGTGTIVGSAVFNILFVIGMCAMVSRSVLQLTWWPLFRDVSFYGVSLTLLIIFFKGGVIIWWEALILFSVYFMYVLFMKFNHKVESFVKMQLHRTFKSVSPSDQAKRPPSRRKHSLPHFRDTHHFRHGALQLMLHTLDPLSDAQNLNEKAVHLQTMARNSQSNGNVNGITGNGVHHPVENGHLNNCNSFPLPPPPLSPSRSDLHNNHDTDIRVNSRENIMCAEIPPPEDPELGEIRTISHPNVAMEDGATDPHRDTVTTQSTTLDSSSPDELPDVEEIDEPLDLSWPSTLKAQITYIVVAPLIFSLWITLPDVRRPEKEKWYPWTFLGSIFWIGGFSYLMLWWASEVGATIGISDAVMGLTFLAAGTSIPDLITSVIVARKGLGDMAVSSSIGSNIFDVTVGLPLPWLLYAMIYNGATVSVKSEGLFCAIILLFAMLMFVIFTIAVCKWRMTKFLGGMMFVLYVIFLTFALLLELKVLNCPFGE